MAISDKILAITEELAKTQKNNTFSALATEYHTGLLKSKLAKYRAQLLEPEKQGKKGDGFDVSKSGYGRVALIGFPSVGKSSLLCKLTGSESAVNDAEFTTLVAVPGILEIDGAKVQLLDLPGIIEGASEGKGRGRQVIAVAKTADLVVMMLDVTRAETQRRLLEIELEAIGIRLNCSPPDVVVKVKSAGGITINSTVPLTKIDDRAIKGALQAYKMHNTDIMIREDITVDQLVDVLVGNRHYVPCLYCYNKIDQISLEEVDRLARLPHTVVISVEMELGLETLRSRIWEGLGLNRVYTKRRGVKPDLGDPLIVKKDASIEAVCNAIHRTLKDHFKYALVWGQSSRFSPQPQKVGLSHQCAGDDIVSVFTK